MRNFEYLFYGTLGMWKTALVDLELNYDATLVTLYYT